MQKFNLFNGLYLFSGGGAASLPTLSVGAPLAVYGMRRMVAGYTGALFRLANASSSPATLDIFATSSSNNAPNVSGVVAWLSGTAFASIDIRYDQTGGGNNETSTTESQRPIFDPLNDIRGIKGAVFDGARSAQRLTIPTAITRSGRDVTLVTVSSFTTSNAGMGSASLGAAWNTGGSFSILNGQTSTSRLQILTSTTFVAVGTVHRGRAQPQVVIVASGASNMVTYQDEETTTLGVNPTGTFVGGLTGRVSVPYSYNGEQYATLIYPQQITSGDAAALKAYLYSEYDILTTANANLILIGNSIVQGTGSTRNRNCLRQAEPNFSRRIYAVNQGQFGQTVATQHSELALRTAQYNAALSKNLIFLGEPTNDLGNRASGTIVGYGTTVWTDFTLTMLRSLISTGFTVIIPTILPRVWTGSAQDIIDRAAERVVWNNLVIANAGAEGYTVCNYGALSNMQTPSNTTYYTDGTHPNTLGYGEMATLLTTTVNSLL